MKLLSLISFVMMGAFAHANENQTPISDSDLRPAEVVDQDLAQLRALDSSSNEQAVEENENSEMNLEQRRGGRGGAIGRGPNRGGGTIGRGPNRGGGTIGRGGFGRGRGPIGRGGYGRGGGYYRGGIWIPFPVPGGYSYPSYSVTCYADNEYGQRFSAWGYYASSAQQSALNQCYYYSRICYPRGCY